jgi:hypothetical protein
MNTVKMKFLKDTDKVKKGEILDVSTKGDHHLAYVKCGIAKIIEEEKTIKEVTKKKKEKNSLKKNKDKEIVKVVSKVELNNLGWYPDVPRGDAVVGSRVIPSFCCRCGVQRAHVCIGSRHIDGNLCYVLGCIDCMYDLGVISVKKVLL